MNLSAFFGSRRNPYSHAQQAQVRELYEQFREDIDKRIGQCLLPEDAADFLARLFGPPMPGETDVPPYSTRRRWPSR